jgi:hypothetical protein
MDSNHPVSSNPHGAVLLLISAPTLETRPSNCRGTGLWRAKTRFEA